MAELEKGTIAYELQELAKAKDDIAAALSSALIGTNENGDPYTSPFIEYGNLIRALTAVNVVKYKDGDGDLDIHELYSPNRVAVYYVSSDTYKEPIKVNNHPTGIQANNFWLLSFCDANNVRTQIAWVRNDTLYSLYIWHSGITNWVKFYTAAEIDTIIDTKIGDIDISEEITNLKNITSVINPSDKDAKPGDIKVVGKDIYIRDGSGSWQLMNSWQ